MRGRTRNRRGNYSLMLAVAIVVLLGFGALAIDMSYMRLSFAQSQDIADAASQAALILLRQTGDQALAQEAAQKVVTANRVAGQAPVMSSILFGNWDDTSSHPAFTVDPVNPNAVRVTVERSGEQAIPYLLARIWDLDTFNAVSQATSATRSFQVILVMDITGSWGERDYLNARAAALTALDMLAGSASGVDEVGMTIFTNRFAWEYTPLTQVAVPANAAAMSSSWSRLMIASKAGRDTNHLDGTNCTLNTGSTINNFTSPVLGGCYPDMPREYRDEPGTDHSTGMQLARTMFEETTTGAVYRAQIVVTDGRPNGLGSPGTARAADHYTETRWREYLGPAPRTTQAIRDESILTAQEMWTGLRVNTWIVSLVQKDNQMFQNPPAGGGVGPGVPQGDGYWVVTSTSSQLADILAQIISEMPLAIVE